MVGFQLGAQGSTGSIYLGDNTSTANGLNKFSGYMTTGSLSGTAISAPATFGGNGCAAPSATCPGADPTGSNMTFGINAQPESS